MAGSQLCVCQRRRPALAVWQLSSIRYSHRCQGHVLADYPRPFLGLGVRIGCAARRSSGMQRQPGV